MKYRTWMAVATAVAIGFVLLVAASVAQDGEDEHNWGNGVPFADAEIFDADGLRLGRIELARFDDAPISVVGVWIFLEGLAPGFHGVHVHSVGSCDATTERPFTSAGGHLNHTDAAHTHGSHDGDLPSIYAVSDGGVAMAYATDRLTVESVLDQDGSAFIVHADPDNFGHIPERYGTPDETTLNTGDAGARIGCGVIEAMEE
jgi:superoxide dismutase, Cu-Zn family